MAAVSFKTKSGEKVSFKSSGRRRTRKLSAYNRFVQKKIKNRRSGQSVVSAMRAAAKEWKKR